MNFSDPTLLILLGLAALGIISHNNTVIVAILVLLIIRLTPMEQLFPWVEKQGLTISIIILTIGARRQRYVVRVYRTSSIDLRRLMDAPGMSFFYRPSARWNDGGL